MAPCCLENANRLVSANTLSVSCSMYLFTCASLRPNSCISCVTVDEKQSPTVCSSAVWTRCDSRINFGVEPLPLSANTFPISWAYMTRSPCAHPTVFLAASTAYSGASPTLLSMRVNAAVVIITSPCAWSFTRLASPRAPCMRNEESTAPTIDVRAATPSTNASLALHTTAMVVSSNQSRRYCRRLFSDNSTVIIMVRARVVHKACDATR